MITKSRGIITLHATAHLTSKYCMKYRSH